MDINHYLNAEVRTRLHPFEAELEHLDTIPGIARITAEVTLAETGPGHGTLPDRSPLRQLERTVSRAR